jgi:hypothetical protein
VSVRPLSDDVLKLHTSTWWLITGGLLLCLFAVSLVGFSGALETLYLRETEAPQLQRDFGFIAAEIRPNPAFPDKAFVITDVLPNGVFAHAGVRVGDRPLDYHGRSELSFYFVLQAARERTVTLRVLRVRPPQAGRDSSGAPRTGTASRDAATGANRGAVVPSDPPKFDLVVGGAVKAPVAVKRPAIEFSECKVEGKRLSGAPVAEAVIAEDGHVANVRLLKGVEPCLDGLIVENFRSWEFKPGTLEGKPVAVRIKFMVYIHYR